MSWSIEEAMDDLLGKVDGGMDYPDAEFEVSCAHRLSEDELLELRGMYDGLYEYDEVLV